MHTVGMRVIVMEQGRIGVGTITAIHEEGEVSRCEVRYGEGRSVTYDARSLIRYTGRRYSRLAQAMEIIFHGFRDEDRQPARSCDRAKAA